MHLNFRLALPRTTGLRWRERLSGLGAVRIGVDLGSSKVKLVIKNGNSLLVEPTFVAFREIRSLDGRWDFGSVAKAMHGKTPATIEVFRPIRQGAIANFNVAVRLMNHLLLRAKEAVPSPFAKVHVFVTVPEAASNVEKHAIASSLASAGASQVTLVRKSLVCAAGVGAGLHANKVSSTMVVDIGGETCEISVVSFNTVIASRSLPIGGKDMDHEIVNHIRRHHRILVSQLAAEVLKENISDGISLSNGAIFSVRGRHAVTGLPAQVLVTANEILKVTSPLVWAIADAIQKTIGDAPPDIMSDLYDFGIILTGGGARLRNIAAEISNRIGLPVHVDKQPDLTITRGLAAVIEGKSSLEQLVVEAQ